jgi:hypothetical protein
MAVEIVEVVEAGGFQRQGLSCFEMGARIFQEGIFRRTESVREEAT